MFFASVGDSCSSFTTHGDGEDPLMDVLRFRLGTLLVFLPRIFTATLSDDSFADSILDIRRSIKEGDFFVAFALNTVNYLIGLVYFCSSLSCDFTFIWKMSAESKKACISFSSGLASSEMKGLFTAA